MNTKFKMFLLINVPLSVTNTYSNKKFPSQPILPWISHSIPSPLGTLLHVTSWPLSLNRRIFKTASTRRIFIGNGCRDQLPLCELTKIYLWGPNFFPCGWYQKFKLSEIVGPIIAGNIHLWVNCKWEYSLQPNPLMCADLYSYLNSLSKVLANTNPKGMFFECTTSPTSKYQ